MAIETAAFGEKKAEVNLLSILSFEEKNMLEQDNALAPTMSNLYALTCSTSVYDKLTLVIEFFGKELERVQKDMDNFKQTCVSTSGLARKNKIDYSFDLLTPIFAVILPLAVIYGSGTENKPVPVEIMLITVGALFVLLAKHCFYRQFIYHERVAESLLDTTDMNNLNNILLNKHGFFNKVYPENNYTRMKYSQVASFFEQVIQKFSDALKSIKDYQKKLWQDGKAPNQLTISELTENKSIQQLLAFCFDEFNELKMNEGQNDRVVRYSL